MNASTNRDAAIALVQQRLRIFPCNVNKSPIIKAWEQNAFDTPLKIEATWQGAPHLLPAIPVGTHGLVVIDCDRRQGKPDGVKAFIELCASIDTSKFFVVETPSTGLHFYFRTDVPYSNSRGSLPDGVDVRGIGGFVIAPGATLPDGRSYRHLAGSWDAIPALPEALAALLREKRPTAIPEPSAPAVVTDREREYAQAALEDEVTKLEAMREGSGRNAALNQAAYSLGTMDGWIDLVEVSDALFGAAVGNRYVAKDGEAAARRTIASGLEAGRSKPRALLPIDEIPQYIRDSVAMWIEAYKAKRTQMHGVTATPFSMMQAKPIQWLWKGYLPSKKLVLLAGQGGVGKSTVAFNWISTVTNGALWPDGTRCAVPGNVLLWSSEDDPEDTIMPRLIAAGATLSHCHFINGPRNDKGIGRSFDPAKDMDDLSRVAAQIGNISLLIIDPIVNAVTGDMNKSNEVRRALQTFVDFASIHGCTVLGITHFTKGSSGKNSSERILGSSAFKDFSRTALVAVQDEESGECALARAKSNVSVNTGGFSYRIEEVYLPNDIETIRVIWGNPLEGSARSILSRYEKDEKQDGNKLSEAKQYLIEVLRNGEVPATEVLKSAREGYGITEDTLRRAYAEIGIRPYRIGFGSKGAWMWALPLANQAQSNLSNQDRT